MSAPEGEGFVHERENRENEPPRFRLELARDEMEALIVSVTFDISTCKRALETLGAEQLQNKQDIDDYGHLTRRVDILTRIANALVTTLKRRDDNS
jgi:hypothetical protein